MEKIECMNAIDKDRARNEKQVRVGVDSNEKNGCKQSPEENQNQSIKVI